MYEFRKPGEGVYVFLQPALIWYSNAGVIIHLPKEEIVFCGDVFLNGLPPLPAEGHLTDMITNLRKLEELEADTYVPGHGSPGTRREVSKQWIIRAVADATGYPAKNRAIS